MSEKALRVVATGDMFITRRIAEDGYEGFEELSDCIKEHDVKFSNLEMTFHNQEGYPAAVSGGTWAMMEPEALDDVKRFGFNLFNTANNHSGDYGSGRCSGNHPSLKRARYGILRNWTEPGRGFQSLLSGDKKGKSCADQRFFFLP